MFERFDADCRQAVGLAQAEARRLRHPFLGTEHLLIGLLADPHGYLAGAIRSSGADLDVVRRQARWMMGDRLDAEALTLLGIDLDRVRDATERQFGPGALEPTREAPIFKGHLPLTRRVRAVLQLSVRAAQRFDHRTIRPEHLMLGLLDDGGGVAVQALTAAGVDLPALRLSIATHVERNAA